MSKVALPAAALTAVITFTYTLLFSMLWSGRTLGRRLVGIRLVDKTGKAPGALRAFARTGFSLLSFALFFSGYWLALFDRRGQTLHDKLAGTLW